MDYKDYQDDSFEQFLQQEVNTHRMYPADDVWNNIRTELHGTRTWPALTVIALTIITSLTFSTLLMTASKDLQANKKVVAIETAALEKQRTPTIHQTAETYFSGIQAHKITAATLSTIEDQQYTVDTNREPVLTVAAAIPTLPATQTSVDKAERNRIELPLLQSAITPALEEVITTDRSDKKLPVFTGLSSQATNTVNKTGPLVAVEEIDRSILAPKKLFSWKKISKLGFQFYATASQSYRVLSDATVKEVVQPNSLAPSSGQNVLLGLDYKAGVNDIVRNSPSIGWEVGVATLYKLNKRLQFKTGIQVNIRQYNIETFKTRTNDVATVSLVNGRSVENINLFSNYSNTGGYRSEQLTNRTYQLSVPVGVQWQVIGGKQLGVSAEASVQPTYNLSNNVYLLSTDYKNYSEGNAFVRRWNINTSIGVNITYKTGKNFWQLGPQVRYQHMPSFTNQYPIKEYLMDYGIRLGLTREWK